MKDQNTELLQIQGITKIYNKDKENELTVLKDVDLTVIKEDFISVVGRSGSGKSTLMNIIGMLDLPTFGEYSFGNVNVFKSSKKQLTSFRREKIGFIFQNFELVPDISAIKNVELPMLYAGIGQKKRTERANMLLSLVGLEDRINHLPNELSGGQKQRVAIARALSNDPPLLLADEPTGALDYENGRKIINLLHELNERGKTIILITHDREIASEAKRIITISNGCIEKGN